MPFLITEPQKIDGTKLGYAVYPYHESFDDHFVPKEYNQKLLIFKMKDSPFVEAEKILHEEHFKFQDIHRGFVDERLFQFVKNNQDFIVDKNKVTNFFSRLQNLNKQ